MVRIITGTAKGKQLLVPHKARPISDRAKSSIFSVIGEDIRNKRILDLYAGSGSLGLESLSRGASSCTFVESDRFAVDDLKKNISTTGLSELAYVARQKVFAFLNDQPDNTFDIVFADPPYEFYKNDSKRAAGLLHHVVQIIPPGGAIVLKHPRSIDIPEIDGLITADSRNFGENTVTLWVRS
jgi:16S rRNA (guanine(966)-N(2))-methyltransferase RsmD